MLSIERHNLILENLQKQGMVSISELALLLGVSEMTVRRDFDLLEQQGHVRRTRGGAILNPKLVSWPSQSQPNFQSPNIDPPFIQRNQLQQSAKQSIGQLAASLLQANEKIILDSGSTVAAMCPYISNRLGLSVITYSIPVLTQLSEQSGIELICTGGTAKPNISALVGPLVERLLEEVRVDKAFISATSLNLKDGFSNSDLENLSLQRIILKVARETYLLVDSSKFTRSAFWLVAPLQSITAIITDAQTPKELIEQFEQARIPIMVAENFGESVSIPKGSQTTKGA